MNLPLVLSLIILVINGINADYEEDTWQEPNAWDRHSRSVLTPKNCPVCEECTSKNCPVLEECDHKNCPVCKECTVSEKLAIFSYQKLIRNLFNNKTLMKSKHYNHLERELRFTITPYQLEIIQNSSNIRDLITVIDDILSKVKSPRCSPENKSYNWLILDILNDCYQILKKVFQSPEVRFAVFIFGIIILIVFFHRRYNKNIIAAVFIVIFSIGYICTYLECNKKLQAEKFIEFTRASGTSEDGIFKRLFKTLFGSSKQDENIHKIRKESELKLDFCRPDQVLMMYANDLFLSQLQLIIEKCSDVINTFNSKLPFAHGIIASICFPFFLLIIIRYVLQYTLNPVMWFQLIKNDSPPQISNQGIQQEKNNQQETQDRLSGENLRLILNALASNNKEQSPLPSGVEEIKQIGEDPNNDSDENKNSKNMVKIKNKEGKEKEIENVDIKTIEGEEEIQKENSKVNEIF